MLGTKIVVVIKPFSAAMRWCDVDGESVRLLLCEDMGMKTDPMVVGLARDKFGTNYDCRFDRRTSFHIGGLIS
jgi:hypothetical protein